MVGHDWLFYVNIVLYVKIENTQFLYKDSFNLDTVATSFHNLVWSKTVKRFIPFFYEDEYGNSCVMLET